MAEEPRRSEQEVVLADGRYSMSAYAFLRDGLTRAGRDSPAPRPDEGPHHVTGEQCCTAMRELAIERWGMLARTVLARWNIHATIDFGNMVYLLIEHGHMSKASNDRIDDFRDVFDFAEAFAGGEEFKFVQ